MTSTQQIGDAYQELRVFRDEATLASIIGAVQVEPHTTFRDLRGRLLVRDFHRLVLDACMRRALCFATPSVLRQACQCNAG